MEKGPLYAHTPRKGTEVWHDLSRISALWAKSDPHHLLWKHLLDAAAVSLALQNPMEWSGWTREQVAWVVGLHDVGKADGGFQHQIPDFRDQLVRGGFGETSDAKCRHERLSAKFILKCLVDAGVFERCADTVHRALIAHHGYWDEDARPVGASYVKAQAELSQMIENVLGLTDIALADPNNHSAAGMRLAGHIVLCDWIASNEEYFLDSRLTGVDDPKAYFEASQEVARDWVRELRLERIDGDAKPDLVVSAPRPLQKAILDNDIPPGLVIIEAPMGEGKTEAAWILAEKWRKHGYNGMYMALPTMATSDSLHSRYRDDYLGRLNRNEATHLVHGMAWLRDEKEPERLPETGEPDDDRAIAAAWFRPTRRAMLAAHGVGTVDQAMLAGMHVKFGFLRLFGLTDRVLVIDEVHAYDAYMSAIICRLLQWCACLDIPVILLSATLSAKQRAAMIGAYGAIRGDPGPEAAYPLITVAIPGKEATTNQADACSSRTLKIETHAGLLGDATATAAQAKELVKDGGCCCVILNTVKQAQAVYTALGEGVPKLLFHARFTAADRQRISEQVLDLFGKGQWVGEGENRKFKPAERPEKFILVATQVVEQSLDVDFDHMITEVAPMDLLLQRSGRLHRHRVRETDPVLHVLTPATGDTQFGGTGYVYADKPLLRTVALLTERDRATLPEDFRILIERAYGDERWDSLGTDWDAIWKADEAWEREVDLMQSQGNQFALCEPSRRVFRPVNNAPEGDDSDDGNGWRAKTRLGANDRTAVLVTESEGESLRAGMVSKRSVKALYRRSIKLARYLPVFTPCEGYGTAIEAEGLLKGLLLLPISDDDTWRGSDERMNIYEIKYDPELGLLARKVT